MSSSTKKELFSSSSMGVLAANLLDKFDKLRKQQSTNEPLPITEQQQATNSSTSTASNLISNLAISFHKNLNTGSNDSPNFNPTCSVIEEAASSITVTANTQQKLSTINSLLVIDDDNFDDDNLDNTSSDQSSLNSSLVKSNSNVNMNSAALIKTSTQITTSLSDCDFAKNTKQLSEEPDLAPKQAQSSLKLSSSSSLYKLSSVLDDLLKNSELTKNSTLNSVVDEAESLKRKFLTKKKSIETSLEIIKNKKNKQCLQETLSLPSSSTESNKNEIDKAQSPTTSVQINQQTTSTPLYESVSSDIFHNKENSKEIIDSASSSSSTSSICLQENTFNEPQIIISNDIKKPSLIQEKNNSSNKLNLILKYKHVLIPLIVSLFVYFIFAPASLNWFIFIYSFGLLTGIAASALTLYFLVHLDLLKYILNRNDKNFLTDNKELVTPILNNQESLNDDIAKQIHSLLIQTAILKENKNFDGIYKGWMNELREPYEPDNYFLNKTRSVYINLDGSMLRLQTTTSKVPKRAVNNEIIKNVSFSDQRIYDLTDCEVFILPKELVRKRYWSKKYPLCLKGVKPLTNKTSSFEKTSLQLGKQLSGSPSFSHTTTSFSNQNHNLNESIENESFDLANNKSQLQQLDSNILILFARTDREKEEWFRLFKKSAAKNLLDSNHYLKLKKQNQAKKEGKVIVSNKLDSVKLNDSNLAFSYETANDKIIYKLKNISESGTTNGTASSQLIVSSSSSSSGLNNDDNTCNQKHNNSETQTENGLLYDTSLSFMNTFLIRMFADFFTHKYWISKIQTKIQNKLNTIKMPYFMEELRITDLDLGCVVPLIKQATEPWYDEKGLWVHLDIDYSGGVQIHISTKLNLMKLKSNNVSLSSNPVTPQTPLSSTSLFSFKNSDEEPSINIISNKLSKLPSAPIEINKSNDSVCLNESTKDGGSTAMLISSSNSLGDTKLSKNSPNSYSSSFNLSANKKKKHLAIIDSDEEDSPESSGDEYVHNIDDENKLVETANTSKKLMNLVNKITASNYFQKATENKYIKMAMENVSNCQLLLNVEVKKISGKIALNIPTHPSDRIWYGFVTNPQMTLVATPQVGEKEVSYSAISDWIADKLKVEFQKVLVFPNMDDFYIPILNSEVDYQNWSN